MNLRCIWLPLVCSSDKAGTILVRIKKSPLCRATHND
jgi:hypothetical protein